MAKKAARKATRKAKGAKQKRSAKPARKAAKSRRARPTARATAARKKAPARKKAAPARKAAPKKKTAARRSGGTGKEKNLAQTPKAGRTVRGRTNPKPTKRSTGTAAGAGGSRRSPSLERERKRLRDLEETVQGPPSSLDMDRHGSAARTGRAAYRHDRKEHTESSPELTGGDVDADWEDAYAVGDEAPGGDNPTPDQDQVDQIGRALGVQYEDNEELKSSDKISGRDKHRWELDPASAEDYPDHEE